VVRGGPSKKQIGQCTGGIIWAYSPVISLFVLVPFFITLQFSKLAAWS